ncbi:hypothetical protein [Mariprofundus ferrooxydans]|uniref:Uncharacterized protein n=1 Tax=Mariprofundus ferrooxydans PV-1 TaxID=314345 RepID=Q0F2F1_9PROT|nr:hypothetical protein [Mariprofundus ferrooxydans]EAU55599.1 hypothetical protein SPV1_01587 [Mariprofundus ferrooxydans PV-1]KON48664.1 hypothetical protein AL013_01455 [Mariprofundus ferrooxydans]
MVIEVILLCIVIFSLAIGLISVARKNEPIPSKKETWKCFFIGLVSAAVITPAFYNLIIVPAALWLLLFAGGVIPWWSRYKKAFAYQWGIFFGITVGLAIIFSVVNNDI